MAHNNKILPLALLKLIEKNEDDIRAGRVIAQDDVFTEIEAQLDRKAAHLQKLLVRNRYHSA